MAELGVIQAQTLGCIKISVAVKTATLKKSNFLGAHQNPACFLFSLRLFN